MNQHVNRRAEKAWLESLPSCSMNQYRGKLKLGAEPLFVLDESSSVSTPVWVLLVKERTGKLARVVTPTSPLARKLKSIRQVYQVARASGVSSINLPVEQKR